MDLPLIVAGAVFLVMLFLVLAAVALFSYRSQRKKILQKIKESQQAFETEPSQLRPGGQESVFEKTVLKPIATLGERFQSTDAQVAMPLRRQMIQAGYRRPNSVAVYYGMKLLLAVLVPGILYLVNEEVTRFLPPKYTLPILALAGVIGFIFPGIWLDFKKSRRKRRLFEGLPDALDLMVVCVEAGMGLDAAIHRVAEEIGLESPIVGEEFKLVGLELRGGKQRSDALRNLAIRTDMEDIQSLVSLLIQTDKFGTSIVQSLKVHADSMRVKRFQMAEEMAAKLPVKLVFPLIFFIFPALFVVIVGPAIISIYRNFMQGGV